MMADHISDGPRAVDPAELYDGPEPGTVTPFPGAEHVRPASSARFTILPDEHVTARKRPDYVAAITAAIDVLNARALALIAVFAACLMWGWAVYQPETERTYAAVAFSVTVLLPVVMLYWRRG